MTSKISNKKEKSLEYAVGNIKNLIADTNF